MLPGEKEGGIASGVLLREASDSEGGRVFSLSLSVFLKAA